MRISSIATVARSLLCTSKVYSMWKHFALDIFSGSFLHNDAQTSSSSVKNTFVPVLSTYTTRGEHHVNHKNTTER